MSYTLIDHNEDFVVVNKAPGITIPRDLESMGLLEKVATDLNLDKLFPVHRLDKATSGLVILARTTMANQALSKIFAERRIQKYYLAISDHKPKRKQGLIQGDMEKSRRGSWKITKSRNNPAITQMFSLSLAPGLRLFLLKPKTGKTHQLRVALKSIAAPILGDLRYGSATQAVDRMYLHAWQLQFNWKGEHKRYAAMPTQGALFTDQGFSDSLAPWRSPEELPWPST
ncbi:MAG: TIGR01621 family pseudouridine synthase [Cellvibrionaceae bacterium]